MSWLFFISIGFLALRIVVVLFNYLFPEKLVEKGVPVEGKLSVLIPARNEEGSIGRLLDDLSTLPDTPLEIIVLDDHSEDNTGMEVKSRMADMPYLRLISGKVLPEDWLGKNWACHQLATESKGNHLLFLDADVRVSGDILGRAVATMKAYELSVLSLFPQQEAVTFGENWVVHLVNWLLLSLLPLRLVRLFRNVSLSAANGQFLLIDARTYHKYDFHLLVRKQVLDDIGIFRAVKARGERGMVALGKECIRCRMYGSYDEAIKGFSKNLLSGFGNNSLFLIGFLILVNFHVIYCFLISNYSLLAISLGMILLHRGLLYMTTSEKVSPTLHVGQMLSLIIIAVTSIYKSKWGQNTWKGRPIPPVK